MAEASETVAVFLNVIENMTKEQACSYQSSMLQQHGCLFSRTEDRSADGEGWTCVTYFHTRAEYFNYGRKENVRVAKLPKGAIEIYRAYDVQVIH
jgi:hypothetical protein